jgi:anti-sigma regulatory factor (Ser/Thr protein kinase)
MTATDVKRFTDSDTQCRQVEAHAPGWRCVWLPHHGVYLAYPDADVEEPRPAAVTEATAEKTLTAIRLTSQLRRLVRVWLGGAYERPCGRANDEFENDRWWFPMGAEVLPRQEQEREHDAPRTAHEETSGIGGDGDSAAPLPQRSTDTVARTPANGRAEQTHRGSTTVLRCCPEHAILMRRYVRRVADLPKSASEVLEGLASELFNNAWSHSRSRDTGTVRVSIFRFPDCTQVKVTDDGPRPDSPTAPQVRPVDTESEHGFGLFMLDSESDRWGVIEEDDGRTSVWFEKDHS